MRIVIDLQAAQTPGSRNRGIGRYSMAVAKAMLRAGRGHHFIIALNGMFADTVGPMRESFAGLIDPRDIRVWHATVPPLPVPGPGTPYRDAARMIRDSFIASLQPDFLHVSSMFEGNAHAVTGVPSHGAGFRTAVTLYDLIPHIYPDVYLPTQPAVVDYAEKIEQLRSADLWLAISESSRQEGIKRIGLAADRVVNISSAADAHFTPEPVPAARAAQLRSQYKLERPFVLYTGGNDHRKNIDGLIRAWGRLPAAVRQQHQLAIVCAMQPQAQALLEQTVAGAGLTPAEVRLPGFVPDDDLVDLYRLCKLFVFPSKHEGFGLPALEAMSCGAPVIGSNFSSIPEVIGRDDALFDAQSEESIAAKMLQCLTDDAFRADLARYGLERAKLFNWDHCANAALDAMEAAAREPLPAAHAAKAHAPRKPRLAFVTPMPPQRSGIADASAEILPHLAAHYDIDLVVDQEALSAPAQGTVLAVRDAAWLMEHAAQYDRIVYQFGNSEYHAFMLPLLQRHPGVVVMHDFYLSGMISHVEHHTPGGSTAWTQALYESHGWQAIAERFHPKQLSDVIFRYPANFGIVRASRGVIVHSQYALRLARDWYHDGIAASLALVPLPRTAAAPTDRTQARARLGIADDEFVVCSFGLLGPTKANHRLLRAWRASPLAGAARCRLVYVGEPQRSPYGRAFETELAIHPGNVSVTGWADAATYSDWLAAADVAVQLRTMSRGETSAAVLDCMNHGLPTIANREGSMADLDPQAVWLLPEEFSEAELVAALATLWHDPARREALSQRAREQVQETHSPAQCAAKYRDAIESFHDAWSAHDRLVGSVAQVTAPSRNELLMCALASAIACNSPQTGPARQLLFDVTAHAGEEAQLPAPALIVSLLRAAPTGWRAEPVYQDAGGNWRYAARFALEQLGCPPAVLPEELVEFRAGDLWARLGTATRPAPPRAVELALGEIDIPDSADAASVWRTLRATDAQPRGAQWFIDVSELVRRDWHSGIQRVVKNYVTELMDRPPENTTVVPVCATTSRAGYFCAERFTWGLGGIRGGRVEGDPIRPRAGDVFFGLDLQPHVVPAQHDYLAALRRSGVATAFMVYDLLPVRLPACFAPGAKENHERWLHEIAQADLAICISQAAADELRQWLDARRTDTQPGLHEPRIEWVHLGADLAHAMSTRGIDPAARAQLEIIRRASSLLMVGTLEPRKSHAQVLAACELLWARGEEVTLVIAGKRGWMVDSLAASITSHPQLGSRLFWFEDASDEFLEGLYESCSALVAASLGEGFGLPLVEAAQRNVAVIARDIPVFREVAGDSAFYFDGDSADDIARSLQQWLVLFRAGQHPRPDGMQWSTWRESANRIKRILARAVQGGAQGAV